VAVVIGLLVAAIASNRFWPLEFFHVVAGAAWTITDLFLGLIIGPILGRMSVPARIELSTRLMPKMVIIMPVVVTCTLAAGWQLGHLLGTIDSSYVNHDWVVASYIIVAIIFAATIAAIAANDRWPLTFLHVAFGAAWTIIDLFLGLVLGPIMGSMPPAARVAFTVRLMPKMLLLMPTVVTITLAAGYQLAVVLGTISSDHPSHGWVVASYIVVGVMAIIALGLLEPANVAVLVELKKPRPNPEVIQRLMKRFIYSAGILGLMQVATLVIMTKLRAG
jgi:hypothetical protein